MMLYFTNMPKNKQQFDEFDQEEVVIKGMTMKRKAHESAVLRKF